MSKLALVGLILGELLIGSISFLVVSNPGIKFTLVFFLGFSFINFLYFMYYNSKWTRGLVDLSREANLRKEVDSGYGRK